MAHRIERVPDKWLPADSIAADVYGERCVISARNECRVARLVVVYVDDQDRSYNDKLESRAPTASGTVVAASLCHGIDVTIPRLEVLTLSATRVRRRRGFRPLNNVEPVVLERDCSGRHSQAFSGVRALLS